MSSYDSYYNELKEKSMTMQVAMLAKDGFLVASDRLVSRAQLATEHRKIIASASGNVVVAAAGSNATGLFAQHWLKTLSDQNLKMSTEETLLESVESAFADYSVDSPATARALPGSRLIVIVQGLRSLWLVIFDRRPHVQLLAGKSESLEINNIANPASFFALQYFSAEKTVDQLLPVAAHTILEGAKIEPDSVGGLDIYVSRTGESPRFLDPAEIDTLCLRSEELHKKITSEFLLS